ncbi:hypothetical protein [Xenorhabdus eapokensis]|uniref:MFS transporter n=1 Tax=Xenorhabdus eapokensis TaxID=1873482 RepID=A0A1Q5TED1_9GAMM|nr:hypothetical protein [Xenorhabdus eapokensis]OKO98588.1 MFS transporter [Xenorhabdus eapokensis]
MIVGENLSKISGGFYGIAFVLILLSQSLASYIAQQMKAKISTSLFISIIMMISFVMTFILYKELSKYFLLLFICINFLLMKLITIHSLSVFLQKQSDNQWATSESFVSSMTRAILLFVLPSLGGIGHRIGIEFIFLSLSIISGIYVIIVSVLIWSSLKKNNTLYEKDV